MNILRCPFRPSTRDLLYTLIKATQDAPAAGGIAIPDGVYTTGLGVSQDGKVTIAGGELTAIQEAQP